MNYPKFAIGEDVILMSKNFPQFNGFETTVIYSEYNERLGWGYNISPDPGPGETDDFYDRWAESSLRKRPSDMSFDQLMESLKKPVNV